MSVGIGWEILYEDKDRLRSWFIVLASDEGNIVSSS